MTAWRDCLFFSVIAREAKGRPWRSRFSLCLKTLKANYIGLKTRDCHAIRKREARNDRLGGLPRKRNDELAMTT